MKNSKVNCDTRVTKSVKDKLQEIADAFGVNRASIQRAAFNRYITDYDNGVFDKFIIAAKEAQDGKK